MTGIYELLLNAVEHGNLKIDKSQKTELLRQGHFNLEIARRLLLPENEKKYVEIEVVENDFFCALTITDQGNGFDWRAHSQLMPDATAAHGRGLLIAKRCGFDHISFNEKGNSVSCLVKNYHLLSLLYPPKANLLTA